MESRIWIKGGSASETRLALEIAQIAGVEATIEQVVEPALVVAFDVEPVPPGVPTVRVGLGLELELPKDAALLAQVMIEATKPGQGRPRQRAIVVAGFHGGAGVSKYADMLARVGGVPVFDASGHPHGRKRTPLTWNDVNAGDPPTLGQYRPGNGEPVIMSARGYPVGVSDPRVKAVVARSRGAVVVDAGIWTPHASELLNASVVLVGKAKQVNKLFEIIETQKIRVIITDKPNIPEMLNAATISGAKVLRPRAWKRIWRVLCA